jgi:hypothetical protein
VNAHALECVDVRAQRCDSLDSLLDLDARVRREASQFVKGLTP